MIDNQFSIVDVKFKQEVAELVSLHLLDDGDTKLAPVDLFRKLLTTTMTNGHDQATITYNFHQLLATPDEDLAAWLDSGQELTDEVFYLVALQLLQFEPALDFQLDDPLKAVTKIHLPHKFYQQWTSEDVIDSWYRLMVTRNKNGQNYLDYLTSQGLFAWTYDLPAQDKPLWFNGKSVACFDPAKLIREVVYIETDLDTDADGYADLVKAEIIRPADTNDGLKVPAVFTASPYNQGTNDQWGEKITHDVNQPLVAKKTGRVKSPAEATFSAPRYHQQVNGHATKATQTFSETSTYTLNDYLAVRGYAIVYAAGIGTKDSDGLQTCGSPEQTDSMKAVVEWLHGDRKAFTDRTSGIEIHAWWCNGNVAMTGRSYLGTLATAVATTGVAGLKAIVSEAAISSWYDYYREGGLVMAPGGFQGEDADVLAAETFSRTKNPADYRQIEETNRDYLEKMTVAQDRQTGNYNQFWMARNYRRHFDNIRADVMMVHGLNDWNVKPVNVKRLFDAVQGLPVASHLILHQGQHIYINAFQSLDFSEMINLWFANKLWGLDNNADLAIPHVLVQDNAQPETWHAHRNWSTGNKRTYYLSSKILSTSNIGQSSLATFNDRQDEKTFKQWCQQPTRWQHAMLADDNDFSLRLLSEPASNEWLLRGTPQVNLRVAVDRDHGMISAQLVDFGQDRRLTTSPQLINKGGLPLGYHWKYDDLREFKLAKQPTPFKVISYGHINLQNIKGAGNVNRLRPNRFENVRLLLQPVFHHLLAGHQLGLVIFSTDFGMTLRGNEDLTYQVDLGRSSLVIPDMSAL